jgi:hypothetical protein
MLLEVLYFALSIRVFRLTAVKGDIRADSERTLGYSRSHCPDTGPKGSVGAESDAQLIGTDEVEPSYGLALRCRPLFRR